MAHLRLVTENDYQIQKLDPLEIQSFDFTSFISLLSDADLIPDPKKKKKGKDVTEYVRSIPDLLKDLYFFTPQSAFASYRVPLSAAQWFNYTPYRLRAECSRCSRILDFDLWTYKQYKEDWKAETFSGPPFFYLKNLVVNKPTHLPWCPRCTQEALPYMARNYMMSVLDLESKSPQELLSKNRDDSRILDLMELGEDDIILIKIYLQEAKRLYALNIEEKVVYGIKTITLKQEQEDPDYLEMQQLTQTLWDVGHIRATGAVGDFNKIENVHFELNSDRYSFADIISKPCMVDAHYFWDELKKRTLVDLSRKLKDAGFKKTPTVSKAMEQLFASVPYKYIPISVEQVVKNLSRDVKNGNMSLQQAQKNIANYLLNYTRNMHNKKVPLKKNQIPLRMAERHMIKKMIGVADTVFDTEPFDTVSRIYS